VRWRSEGPLPAATSDEDPERWEGLKMMMDERNRTMKSAQRGNGTKEAAAMQLERNSLQLGRPKTDEQDS
jgi:hypothetical protein